MRTWLPQRPLTGPEVVGLVVVAFIFVPFLIGGFLSLVMALSNWPAVLGLIAGAVGALIVHHTLTREAIVGRQRIAELERENAQLAEQVRHLEEAVDRYIDGSSEGRGARGE
jgi:membrane protein implicated in regulation of membrane protease activity